LFLYRWKRTTRWLVAAVRSLPAVPAITYCLRVRSATALNLHVPVTVRARAGARRRPNRRSPSSLGFDRIQWRWRGGLLLARGSHPSPRPIPPLGHCLFPSCASLSLRRRQRRTIVILWDSIVASGILSMDTTILISCHVSICTPCGTKARRRASESKLLAGQLEIKRTCARRKSSNTCSCEHMTYLSHPSSYMQSISTIQCTPLLGPHLSTHSHDSI
jgi:hypothetical protein